MKLSDPDVLRKRANDLLRKAKDIEDKKFILAGKVIHKYYKDDFKDFDIEKFKSEIRDIFEVKKSEE